MLIPAGKRSQAHSMPTPEALKPLKRHAGRLTGRSNRSILGFEWQKPLQRGFLDISVAWPAQYADTSD